MHTINLYDFADYQYKDLYKYLMQQNETSFRICIERRFIAPKDDKIMIATDYYDAFYFGEKLSELSHEFSYSVPSEFSSYPFVYELITSDMEKLADTMFFLIRGNLIDSETENIEKYCAGKKEFWNQYCNGKIEPVCLGLTIILEKYI